MLRCRWSYVRTVHTLPECPATEVGLLCVVYTVDYEVISLGPVESSKAEKLTTPKRTWKVVVVREETISDIVNNM